MDWLRVNEVFLSVASTAEAAGNVVFFPGDAQDSNEKMYILLCS